MRRIRWTVPAVDDLESIKNYLQQHFPHFAELTVRTIYQRIRSLKISANRGGPEAVEIPHFYHGAQGSR